MKEIFFTTVLLFTLFSCSTDDQKEVLSYSEIGVSQAGKLKTEPKQTEQLPKSTNIHEEQQQEDVLSA